MSVRMKGRKVIKKIIGCSLILSERGEVLRD
jgi:hypothetical protein